MKKHTQGFWKNLEHPIKVQAPMEDVTDTVFRQMLARHGAPDVYFTEFTSTDGLCSPVGTDQVRHRLRFDQNVERPIVAQIWGNDPEKYYRSAQMLVEMGFDGVDINMGCPVRSVVSKGHCSGLIRNPALAKELIQAAKEGAPEIPVSVKTRIGVNKIVTEEWMTHLLSTNPSVITVHGRTAQERSDVPVHWDEIAKVVDLRNANGSETLIIGNGDIVSLSQGEELSHQYGLDGFMIARGMLKNIRVFNTTGENVPSPAEKLSLLIEHITLFDQTWGDPEKGKGKSKPFRVMRKYYKIYCSGFKGASALRMELMGQPDAQTTITYLQNKIGHLAELGSGQLE